MTVTAVDMHSDVTLLTVYQNGDITYDELFQITATGDDPLVDPVLGAWSRNVRVKPGDPDTGIPKVEDFRSDVA